jgi:hypothetical protein
MISLLAAAGIALAGTANAADTSTMSRDTYNAGKNKIETQYKADESQCSSMSGNAKDICKAEAKGKEKVAKADLEASYKNTDRARYDARVAKADADYGVAKEKCDDMSGNAKDVCVKQAKAEHTKARSGAKVAKVDDETRHEAASKRTEARKDAHEDTRDAQYKVAVEKCDAMGGAAKDQCVKDAKVHYGRT